MQKNKTKRPPEAAAPGNPLNLAGLRDEYLKLARGITATEDCVCWLLDLQDDSAMRLAQALQPNAPYKEFMKTGLQLDAVPIVGITSIFEYLRLYSVTMGAQSPPPPPPGFHYLVVVTPDTRVAVLQSAIAVEQQGLN